MRYGGEELGPSVYPLPQQEEILAHLDAVLASPAFSSSRRSCQFLRYVVESALADEKDLLKERVIGERVFGRTPDYDTGQDSIVRVKANEVRRRLAQYYDLHADASLRIDLPAGAYSPRFHMKDGAAPILSPSPRAVARNGARRSWSLWIAGAVAVALAALAVARVGRPVSAFTSFWEPFLAGTRAPILCLPTPERFRISGENKGYLIDKFHPRPPGEAITDLSVERIQGVQILPETGVSIGLGDAHTLTLLYAFLSGKGHVPEMRIGKETSFAELRAGPVVLIGGFTNRWTLDLMKDARFAFEQDTNGYGIRDRVTGKDVCRKPRPWEPPTHEDCGVITRLRNSKTGYPLLIAAGLDNYGTYGSGDFLTNVQSLEHALQQAPRGWQEKNLQIVFRIEIVHEEAGTPSVVATYAW